ncbi:hypothetical protein CRG98_021346 [Punica granatum]|uniref:Uncharacterized protein n=1 Tax=Punica granatum TaxID=22663 RepID=A0A2I0JPP5_PUNGR|nr:hypothetical protein CRG98_021346 [Punica granatum]
MKKRVYRRFPVVFWCKIGGIGLLTEYSWSRFAQEIDHYGPTNCNAKIVNRFLDAQVYSSFGFLAQFDQFIDFTVSKRASQVQP